MALVSYSASAAGAIVRPDARNSRCAQIDPDTRTGADDHVGQPLRAGRILAEYRIAARRPCGCQSHHRVYTVFTLILGIWVFNEANIDVRTVAAVGLVVLSVILIGLR